MLFPEPKNKSSFTYKSKTKEEWIEKFSLAKAGHVCWDGNAKNPSDPSYAYESAYNFKKHACFLGFFKDNSKILDLGCGNGRMGIIFSEMNVQYYGIDPMLPCIQFCKNTFKEYPHLNFRHMDIWNECSNPTGKILPEKMKLPFPDGYFTDVIAYSVFTHLQTLEVAQNYISEIKRVLKGNFFCSWYRSPPNKKDSYVGRTVYQEKDIMNMMNGFNLLYTHGGHSDAFYDQWIMFCMTV